MSRGITGLPSPKIQKASRPLSMISENPDDSTGDAAKVKAATAITHDVTGQCQGQANDEVDSNSRSSSSTMSNKVVGFPVRRKAVAPLQHPVTIIFEKQYGSSSEISDQTQSPSPSESNVPEHQKKILIPETTATVSSIIKRFSTIDNKNNNSTNNSNNNSSIEDAETKRTRTINNNGSCGRSGGRNPWFPIGSLSRNSKQVKFQKRKNTPASPLSDCDQDSGIASDILGSPEVFDNNHNNVLWKSSDVTNLDKFVTNSYGCGDNDCDNFFSNSNDNNKVISDGNNSSSKSSFDSPVDENNRGYLQIGSDEAAFALQNNYSQHINTSLSYSRCESSRENQNNREITQVDHHDNIRVTRHNNNINTVFHTPFQVENKRPCNDQETHTGIHNSSNYSSSSPLSNDRRSQSDTQSESDMTSSKDGDDSVFNSSEELETADAHLLTSTPNFKATATVTLCFQNSNNPNSNNTKHSHIHNIVTQNSQQNADVISKQRIDTLEPKHSFQKSEHEEYTDTETSEHHDTSDPQPDSASVLDGETLEWKKRVTRSVSLIRVPSFSDRIGQGRRISSIHSKNHTSENSSETKHRLKHDNMGSKTNDNDSIIPCISKQNSDSRVTNQSNLHANEPVRRISAIDQSNFSLLKVATTRLNLPTRRPSVTAWKEKYLNKNSSSLFESSPPAQNDDVLEMNDDEKKKKAGVCGQNDLPDNLVDAKGKWDLTEDVKNRINSSLAWLRQELIDIRILDQSLARQFLDLREAMNAFRLAVECEDHQELIEDAEEDMEEIRQLSQLVDIPPEMLCPVSPLKHVGITRMNISSRRFSTC